MSEHTETTEELRDVLQRNGFVRCDIAACNCGSWHARYGYRQRLEEVTELIADAGHPLTNENGHLVKAALTELIAERDSLRAVSAELMEALTNLMRNFPTDHDMKEAGWDGVDIEKACTAHDKAREAIVSARKQENHHG